MLKTKDMRRSEWKRITEREYISDTCSFNGKSGIASVLLIRKVTEPLVLHYESGDITIANEGDTWLQIALEGSYLWMTAMYDSNDELIQIYFDLTAGNHLENPDNPTFEDAFLDVVMEADGKLHVLDREELEQAVVKDVISVSLYQTVLETCDKLCNYLQNERETFLAFCKEQLIRLKYQPDTKKNASV